jgi:hypothetical protein
VQRVSKVSLVFKERREYKERKGYKVKQDSADFRV